MSSRRATRSRARSSRACRRPASARWGWTCARVDPALFPNVFAALREAGLDPRRELVPVAPAAHYMMGGVRDRPRRRARTSRALRGRRGLVHRPARSQPPRLQLAERVLRVRQRAAAAARSTSRRAAATRSRTRERRHGVERRAPPPVADAATREALWRDAGIERDARGPGGAARRSLPARAPDRAVRARARARAGARTSAPTTRRHRAPIGLHHIVLAAEAALSWETWD